MNKRLRQLNHFVRALITIAEINRAGGVVGSLCQTELTLCKLSTAPLRERRGLLRALGVLWAGKWAKPGGYHVPSKPSRGGIRAGPELCSW